MQQSKLRTEYNEFLRQLDRRHVDVSVGVVDDSSDAGEIGNALRTCCLLGIGLDFFCLCGTQGSKFTERVFYTAQLMRSSSRNWLSQVSFVKVPSNVTRASLRGVLIGKSVVICDVNDHMCENWDNISAQYLNKPRQAFIFDVKRTATAVAVVLWERYCQFGNFQPPQSLHWENAHRRWSKQHCRGDIRTCSWEKLRRNLLTHLDKPVSIVVLLGSDDVVNCGHAIASSVQARINIICVLSPVDMSPNKFISEALTKSGLSLPEYSRTTIVVSDIDQRHCLRILHDECNIHLIGLTEMTENQGTLRLPDAKLDHFRQAFLFGRESRIASDFPIEHVSSHFDHSTLVTIPQTTKGCLNVASSLDVTLFESWRRLKNCLEFERDE